MTVEISDGELIKGCVSGEDRASWEIFVRKHSKLIWNSALKTFRAYTFPNSKEDIEDVYGLVFLSLIENDFRKLRQFRSENACSLSTWLTVVTVRKTIDFIRRDKRHLILEPQTEGTNILDHVLHNGQNPDIELEEKEKDIAFNKALHMLSPQDKLLYDLLYNWQFSPEESAKILCLSLNTVYSKKHRIIERIKKNIKDLQEKENSCV